MNKLNPDLVAHLRREQLERIAHDVVITVNNGTLSYRGGTPEWESLEALEAPMKVTAVWRVCRLGDTYLNLGLQVVAEEGHAAVDNHRWVVVDEETPMQKLRKNVMSAADWLPV